MTGASSGPCGRIRFAVADASGSWALLASQSLQLREGFVARLGDVGDVVRVLRTARAWGGAGFSQSRGSSWIGDVDARLQPPAKRAARLGNADRVQVPTHHAILHPALTARSRNWQGRVRANAPCAARREDRMSERESMQYDVVIVGAGPAGLTRGDPPEAAGGRGRARDLGLHPRKRQRGRRAHPVGRGDRSQGARTS